MPLTFPSHQAIVLPLKLKWPRCLDGVALCVGSMAPDFQNFVLGEHSRHFAHGLPGQFLFCLPVGVLITLLVRRVIARPLAPHLPSGGRFRLRDYHVLSDWRGNVGDWLLMLACVLIGSFSHLFWDGLTHRSGWAAPLWPGLAAPAFHFRSRTVALYELLQHLSSLVGVFLSLGMLLRVGRERLLLRWHCDARNALLPTPESRRILTGTVLLGGIAGIAWGIGPGLESGHWLRFPVWAPLGFRTMDGLFAGLCVGCALAAARMRPPCEEFEPGPPNLTPAPSVCEKLPQ